MLPGPQVAELRAWRLLAVGLDTNPLLTATLNAYGLVRTNRLGVLGEIIFLHSFFLWSLLKLFILDFLVVDAALSCYCFCRVSLYSAALLCFFHV